MLCNHALTPGALHKTIPDTWADHNRPPTIKYSAAGERLPERACDISFQRLNARGRVKITCIVKPDPEPSHEWRWTNFPWQSLSTNILSPRHDSIGIIALQDTSPGEILRYLPQVLVKLWFNSLSARLPLSPPNISFAPLRGALRRAGGTPGGVEVSLVGTIPTLSRASVL